MKFRVKFKTQGQQPQPPQQFMQLSMIQVEKSLKQHQDILPHPTFLQAATSPFVFSPYDETQLSLFASYSLIAISDNYISNYATGSTGSSSSSTATPTTSTATPYAHQLNHINCTIAISHSYSSGVSILDDSSTFAAVLLLSIVFVRKRTLKK